MAMKFKLDDSQKIVTHWMLQSSDIAEAVSKTDEWIAGLDLEARVTVNGVELPFEVLETYFLDIYNGMDAEIRASYKDMEAEVQRRLEARMTAEAQPILDKFYELTNVLESAGDLIKPWWDREK